MATFKVIASGKDFAYATKLLKKRGTANFNPLTKTWDCDEAAANFCRDFPEYLQEVPQQSPNFTDSYELRDHS